MAKSVAFVQVIIALAIICMLVNDNNNNIAEGKEEFTCGVVNSCLFPCQKFLETGEYLPTGCCDGFEYLVNEAKTKADLQTACYCLKKLMISEKIIERLAVIPEACYIKTPFVISPHTDCSQVN